MKVWYSYEKVKGYIAVWEKERLVLMGKVGPFLFLPVSGMLWRRFVITSPVHPSSSYTLIFQSQIYSSHPEQLVALWMMVWANLWTIDLQCRTIPLLCFQIQENRTLWAQKFVDKFYTCLFLFVNWILVCSSGVRQKKNERKWLGFMDENLLVLLRLCVSTLWEHKVRDGQERRGTGIR